MNVRNQEDLHFVASVLAHEIRNPLTTVKGFLQLLKPHLADIGKEQYAEIAIKELNRANDLIMEFLNANNPKSVGQEETSKVNDLIREVVLLFESEANLKNITICTDFSSDNPESPINSNKLKQVLLNLIKNAMEAVGDSNCKAPGAIDIKTNIQQNNVLISISDNGKGMSKETLERLFTPFYTTKEKGNGIGLSVCEKIIKDHGGTILVWSKEYRGTQFHITLPLFHKDYLAYHADSKKISL